MTPMFVPIVYTAGVATTATATAVADPGVPFDLNHLASFAGPIAIAAFAGVFLGGLALSFFWKNFGPWQLLESARTELAQCRSRGEIEQAERAKLMAKLADVEARYETLLEVVNNSGMGMRLTPRNPI